MKLERISEDWIILSDRAWAVRENSYIFGKTKVGAGIISENGNIYLGSNIEHIFRSHDIHAEVNAISNMICSGDRKILKLLIVAERDIFTPCGACMDWIMQFSDPDTLIGFQNTIGGDIRIFSPSELMPMYPR